jgi:branched-chain amino acid transport system permease protein
MVELFINGLFVGALYALFGLGLAVTFGVMRQINLAHGDLIVLSAYAAWLITEGAGWHPLVSLPLIVILMFGLGYVLQRWLLNRTLGQGGLPPLLVTFGLSIVLQNLMLMGFSADTRGLDPGAFGAAAFTLGPISVGIMPFSFFILAIAVFAALAALFGRTGFGRAVGATADDGRVALLMGIDTRHIFAMAMALALAASAVAAVFLGMRSTFSPSAGPERMLYAFEAVILGGLGSIWGTFIGGLVLGLSQAVGLAISPIYGPLAGHLAFLAVLLFRPQGLLSIGGRSR